MEQNSKPHHMLEKKNKKYCIVGILTYNAMVVDDTIVEWIEEKDFSLASVARLLGLDENKNVKAKITLGDRLCQNCGKMICDECAKTDTTGDRYCPICYDLKVTSSNVF
jgi:hypothetical protein